MILIIIILEYKVYIYDWRADTFFLPYREEKIKFTWHQNAVSIQWTVYTQIKLFMENVEGVIISFCAFTCLQEFWYVLFDCNIYIYRPIHTLYRKFFERFVIPVVDLK